MDRPLSPGATCERISGVVRFFERTAPEKRVFYEGNYNGVFSFYLLSRDPKFQRGVVLGRKLLYEVTMNPELSRTKRVSSAAEVVDLLRTKCGCRWLAVERGMNRPEAEKYLREAIARPEFEFVKAFPIAGPRDMWIDVYRFIIEKQESKKIELFFPELGEATVFHVKPLER